MAAPSSRGTQVTQLLELLVKSLAPGAPASALAGAVATASSQPRPPVGTAEDNDDRANVTLDALEQVLVQQAGSDGGGSSDAADTLARFRTLRRRLLAAGRPDSGLAAFRDKASLVALLGELRGASAAVSPPSLHAHLSSSPAGAAAPAASSLASLPELHQQRPQLLPAHAPAAPAPAPARQLAPVAAPAPAPSAAASPPPSLSDTLSSAGVLPPAAEAALVRDLLFVFQGIDGHYVRWQLQQAHGDGPQQRAVQTRRRPLPAVSVTALDDEGAGFVCADVVDGYAVPAQVARTVHVLAELGWLYRRINKLVDPPAVAAGGASSGGGSGTTTSLARHAFLGGVRAELDAYFRQLAGLDAQLAAAQGQQPGGAAAAAASADNAWTLHRLRLWAAEPLQTLRTLAVIVESCDGLAGGPLLSTLDAHGRDGDPAVAAMATRLLSRVCRGPIRSWVREWVSAGELPAAAPAARRRPAAAAADGDAATADASSAQPPESSEFFIAVSPSSLPSGAAAGDADDEASRQSWTPERFHVVPSAVPSFWPPELAASLLATGRAVHFIRHGCGDGEWVRDAIGKAVAGALAGTPSAPAAALLPAWAGDGEARALAAAAASSRGLSLAREEDALQAALAESGGGDADPTGVGEAARLVGAVRPLAEGRLVHLLTSVHGLPAHLRALQRYVLFAAADFASALVTALAPELDKPAHELAAARHSLEAGLEGACRATTATAAADDGGGGASTDRLQVTLLPPSAGDVGWDTFTLTYVVPPPLAPIIYYRTGGGSLFAADGSGSDALADVDGGAATYARLSSFLWRVRRCEHVLSGLWSAGMSASHALRRLGHRRLDVLMHATHRLRADTAAWLSTLSSYLTADVLAGAGRALDAAVAGASGLDALLAAHAAYLASLADKCFLSPRTAPVAAVLQRLMDGVLDFAGLHQGLLAGALAQAAERRAYDAQVARRRAEGALRGDRDWGCFSRQVCQLPSRLRP